MPGGDFVFGKAKWTRYLIKPPEGWGISYLDWVAQEVIVLAAVSRDPKMLADYANGDPYLTLAVASGLAPAGATKASHREIRDACKVAFLAICYGVGTWTLARETGLTPGQAAMLIAGHEARYRRFHQWRRGYLNRFAKPGTARNRLGWPWWTGFARSDRTIMDFPAQSNGSAMMQIAAIMATEAGIGLAATVHDGLLIVAPEDRLDADTAAMKAIMEQAGKLLLGVPVRVEVDQVVRWPDRFDPDPKAEKGAKHVWELVNQELRKLGQHPEQAQAQLSWSSNKCQPEFA